MRILRTLARPFKAWWKNFNCPHLNKRHVCGFWTFEDQAAHGGYKSKWVCDDCGQVLYSKEHLIYSDIDYPEF